MGRVSQDTIDKLNAFIDSLPEMVRSKCALCSETLTHVVKKAEVETGAGTATVARVLADRLNDGAAPGDVVSSRALEGRVERMEKPYCPDSGQLQPNTKTQQAPVTQIATEAHQIAHIVISQLTRIRKDDPLRDEAYDLIINFIAKARANQ